MGKREQLGGGGKLDQPLIFYAMIEVKQPDSSVLRTATEIYRLMGAVGPYLGLETRSALREIGEVWATIQIRYFRSRVPEEGMQIDIRSTGERYEIRGVMHVEMSRRKVELTCRLIR